MDRASWKILILLQIAGLALAREYVLDSLNIFTECLNPPPGAKGFDRIADLSKLNIKKEADGLHISGNFTTVWDVGPTDRIEASIAVLMQERGVWKPTALAANVRDFCKEMYDKNTLYYPYSTKFISNKEDVKDKCLTQKGTILLVDTFVLKIVLGVAVPLRPGPHRVVLNMAAFDSAGVQNPNIVCVEVPGHIV